MTANATIFIINHTTTPVAALKKSLASVQQQLPAGSEIFILSATPLPANVAAPAQLREQSPLTCYLAQDPWVWHFEQHSEEGD